jgi:hypothetical protein
MPRLTAAEYRRLLCEVLERHGLTAVAADSVRAHGLRLREEMLRQRQEQGAMIDAETGEQLGGDVPGTSDRVEMGPLLRLMEPGRRYAVVHTHPSSLSLSPHDAALVLRFRSVCVISSVGKDGGWCVLSADPARTVPTLEEMAAAYRETYQATLGTYIELVQAGTLTRGEAQRAQSHDIWVRAAPPLGLRYDRLEGRRHA